MKIFTEHGGERQRRMKRCNVPSNVKYGELMKIASEQMKMDQHSMILEFKNASNEWEQISDPLTLKLMGTLRARTTRKEVNSMCMYIICTVKGS